VLRKHLAAAGRSDAAETSPRWYRETAYIALLSFLGLEYEELRAIAGKPTASKADFIRAKGLGVKDDAIDAQVVDDFYRDVAADPDPTLASALTEDYLQDQFGFRSTRIDPLAPDQPYPLALKTRERVLRAQWITADAGTTRSLGPLPIVDPDLVDEIDIVDRAASPPGDQPDQWKPIDFLHRRRAEIQTAEALIAVGFTPTIGTTPDQRLKTLFLTLATSQSFLLPSQIPVPPFGFQAGGDNLDYPKLRQIRDGADKGADV
jgi:hypothetical protein